MNYTTDEIRNNYRENQKNKMQKITMDEMRELGYTEEDIAKGII